MVVKLCLCLFLLVAQVVVSTAGSSYIINGNDVADIRSYPWQCSLRRSNTEFSHKCGAALISSKWLLTAAHCVDGVWEVSCGSVDRQSGTDKIIRVIIKHPDYGTGPGSYPNDIALLMTDPFPLGETIQMIQMDSTGDDHSGETCNITGWGYIETGYKKLPRHLQEATVNVFSNMECRETWANQINDGHVCVGGTGRGICQGDSGGPLQCGTGTKARLVGITSWLVRGCYPEYPSVYSRVAHFRSWIRQNTGI